MQIEKSNVILDTPKKGRQLRHSNFFITINTNQRYTGHEEEYEQFVNNFKRVLDGIFDNLANLITVTKDDDKFDDSTIKKIGIQSVIEKAPKTNAIHAHILVKVAHYTSVKFNIDYFKEQILAGTNLKNIYIQIKMFRNANDILEKYIYKNQEKLSQ